MNTNNTFRSFLAAAALALALAVPSSLTADTVAPPLAADSLPRPLTLSAALAFAAQHNPELRHMREQIREQEGVLLEVQAQRSPRLDLTSRYSQTRFELAQFPGVVAEAWQTKLTASKVLYAGGSIRAGIGATSEQVEIARLTYLAREQDVLLAVRQCFFSVLLDRELIAVREDSIAVLETVLANALHRHVAGLGSRFDVIRAEAALAHAQPALLQARSTYRVAQDKLCRLLGTPATPGERDDLGIEGTFPADGQPPALSTALATASQQRAELLRQKHAVAAADHGLAASRGADRPTLAAQAGYEYTGSYFSRSASDNIPGWSFGLEAKWALFDGKATAGKIEQARARTRQARLGADELALNIDLEVRESHAAVLLAGEMLQAAAKTVAEATESLRLAKASEQEGMATQLDVLTAQAALTEARAALSQARFGTAITAAQLRRALGETAIE